MNNKVVFPSSQVETSLPLWIRSPDTVVQRGYSYLREGVPSNRNDYRSLNSKNFVNFMKSADESEERQGYGQDLLQNLLEYRNFDSYKDNIIQYNILTFNGQVGGDQIYYAPIETNLDASILAAQPQGDAAAILAGIPSTKRFHYVSKNQTESLELADGTGFPEENGVILVDDEVIYYRRREGNFLYDLQRGASATSVLPTYRSSGEYKNTEPQDHFAGSVVVNLSVLFMVAMLDSIHKTYAVHIDSTRVVPEINRSSLLQNIKDFFRSKGTKLGIKALFKILFAETDVDVFYPGDRMIIPSKSTWHQPLIIRSVPIPEVFCNPEDNYVLPDKGIGTRVEFKSYSATIIDESGKTQVYQPEDVFAETFCEYASSYLYDGTKQYEMILDKNSFKGDIIVNPTTVLTRDLLRAQESNDIRRDVFSITVESTLGFPQSGVLFVENEAIFYTGKSLNQFLGCKRGYIGVEKTHIKNTKVYGPYYIETKLTDENGIEYTSRSWPMGLVESVDIVDPGLLHTAEDSIVVDGQGRVDPREEALCKIDSDNSIIDNFLENYQDDLVTQKTSDSDLLAYVGNFTHGVDGVFFDDRYIYVSSSGFPDYPIGSFSLGSEGAVGPNINPKRVFSVLPRRNILKQNIKDITAVYPEYIFESKGTDQIGIFNDGVRAYSNNSVNRLEGGSITKFIVKDAGINYRNPTVLIEPKSSEAEAVVDPKTGKIIEVVATVDGFYEQDPKIRITEGEGAVFYLWFDRYGRIIEVAVDEVKTGNYYKDTPALAVIDDSGKGKGAVLTCTVFDQHIESVEIVNAGIDYNPDTTRVVTITPGRNAVIEAEIRNYTYNRYTEVENNPNWKFDDGGAFLYEDAGSLPNLSINNKTIYGYIANPTKLRTRLNDDGQQHSPILGFAFDGNPIYGPYGYANDIDDSFGIQRQESGYVLKQDRSNDVDGIPPDETEYPMGTFIEDYEFVDAYGNLDENNGKFCNTPDYPVELYPDGVFCYFITIDNNNKPAFPYILGKTFQNRPISQVLDIKSMETVSPLPRGITYSSIMIDDVLLEFDFTKVERLRNNYLISTKDDLQLSIDSIGTGGISKVYIQDGGPDNNKVGDLLYFNDEETGGGGAQALITYIDGKDIISAEGLQVSSEILSHRQKITIAFDFIDAYGNTFDKNGNPVGYTFVKDTTIEPYDPNTGDQSKAKILSYDETTGVLIVQTSTKRLILDTDKFFDNKGRQVVPLFVEELSELAFTTKLWIKDRTDMLPGDLISLNNSSYDIVPVCNYIDGGDTTIISYEDSISGGELSDLQIGSISGGTALETVCDVVTKVLDPDSYSYGANDEIIKIVSINPDGSLNVIRRFEPDIPREIPHETPVYNVSRYIYSIETSEQHNIQKGDVIKLHNSFNEELNRTQEVSRSGFIQPAIGEVYVQDGKIRLVNILNGGGGYIEDFYVEFVDISGSGAVGFANVDKNTGRVLSVDLVSFGQNYSSDTKVLFEDNNKNTEFIFYTDKLYGADSPEVYYTTTSETSTGKASEVKVTSPGVGYRTLPPILGVYKKLIDRANLKIKPQGSMIGEVEVIYGGARYKKPKAVFYDLANRGSGASAKVTVQNGIVQSIKVIDGGDNYVEPMIQLVETEGKYIPTTNDIGKLKSIGVVNPGRNISADRSLKPEILITTRCLVLYGDQDSSGGYYGDINTFYKGDMVYQGLDTHRYNIGVVVDYDHTLQMITIENLLGTLNDNELIYSERGAVALVVNEGQSDCRVVVDGTSTPKGTFIDDTSKINEWYSVIQDSYRYQWFSYVISSPIQQMEYDTFVESIIHPTGFIRFADLSLHDSVDSDCSVSDDDFEIDIIRDFCESVPLVISQGNVNDTLDIILTNHQGNSYELRVNPYYCNNTPAPSPGPGPDFVVKSMIQFNIEDAYGNYILTDDDVFGVDSLYPPGTVITVDYE